MAGKTALILLTPVIAILSCAGSGAEKKDPQTSATQPAAAHYDPALRRGTVIDSVICQSQPGVSYALYLPSNYTSARPFPCIYFFDAHARGPMPVRSYHEIAEKYGFIMIGSNVSKNGTPKDVTESQAQAMFTDSRSRVNIDPKRVYLAGFSGGSRVASSIALADGGVAGVIACGAGFPSNGQIPSQFDFFGIAGDVDFNYTEMRDLDGALEKNGTMHQLLTFNGIHTWPSAADMQTAILWMQVAAMKRKIQPLNDTLMLALKADYNERIEAAGKANDLIAVHDLLAAATLIFGNTRDDSTFKFLLDKVSAKKEYNDAVAQSVQLTQQEMKLQQDLAQQFAAHHEHWWADKINELHKAEQKAGTKSESKMYQRVVNYLGLVSYMSCDRALKTGDMAHADVFLKIFKIADPKNPDADYMRAVWYAKSGDSKQAVASLKVAASLGYSDVSQLMNDPALSIVSSAAGFSEVLAEVEKNYKGKK